MSQKLDLQPEDFTMFLAWLGSDPEAACRQYEEVRSRLVKLFVCRGCSDPDSLADETIDRVVAKIKHLKDNYVGDSPIKYIYGVARNVYFESLRQNRRAENALKAVRPSPELTESSESSCLKHCLERLPDDQAKIFLDYYQNEEKPKKQVRQELADALNIDINTLRVKIHRARQFLQNCLRDCLNKN